MSTREIINQLEQNKILIPSLLSQLTQQMVHWKPSPQKWSLLQVLCHLVDEEREDFRIRTRMVLESPEKDPPAINPSAWVDERSYSLQDFYKKLEEWVQERQQSIDWLNQLSNPPWGNTYYHPKIKPRTAKFYLVNWLAHDHIHIRQINRNKMEYLIAHQEEDLSYAGNW